MVTKGERRGGMNWEIGIYNILYIIYKKTDMKFLYSTGNVMTYMRKESKKECIYAYVELIPSSVHVKLTQHCKSTIR